MAPASSPSGFVSPVTKYERLREDELRAQQERLKSVRVSKRKLSADDAAAPPDAPRVAFAPVIATAATAKKKPRRASGSSGGKADGAATGKSIAGVLNNYMKKVETGKRDPSAEMAAHSEKKRFVTFPPPPPAKLTAPACGAHNERITPATSVMSPEMFSRAVDASFSKVSSRHAASSAGAASVSARRPLKHFDSLAVAKNKLERQREAAEWAADADAHSRGAVTATRLPKRSARLVTSVKDEDVVDLEHVTDVARLETVEGSEILQAMMSTGTPRAGRAFPAERGRPPPSSDESERAFLQRRHLALRSKYMATGAATGEAIDAKWEYREESGGTIVIGRKKEAAAAAAQTTARRKLAVDADPEDVAVVETPGVAGGVEAAQLVAADDSHERSSQPAPVVAVAAVDDESDDGDKETTASKVARVSQAKGWRWTDGLLWLAAASAVLCALILAPPSAKALLARPTPFCDSVDTSAAASLHHFDDTTALQPYTGAAASAVCRACPLFGNCSDGQLRSCLPPYELYNSACVENSAVRQDLQDLAGLIHAFVVRKAAERLGNVSLWEALVGGRDFTQDAAAPVTILLSEIQALLAGTISYGKSLSQLPRQYVFTRALDLALRDLRDIFVSENHEILVGRSVAPWWSQAKHQLYANARWLVLGLGVSALLAAAAWRRKVRRIERGLLERLVKEVRFALLQRTAKPTKWYPAAYLRDDLFDLLPGISPQDRKWLRESVWPRVMAIVAEDSRVRSSSRVVSGDEMVVWEWISSASPAKAPNTLQTAKEALVKLAGGRRKKPSRKSFPM
ncbi:hypothetical protein PybrP1_000902 [[Pythium] brassicae (nom. inval.)]|nr:hypothetical protein PybrP1_000902 [[Pythium] brassicae (nom. inval.)]